MIAALILSTPALSVALGHSLWMTVYGDWVHHHTREYTTCNAINQDTGLAAMAEEARQNWANLSYLDFTAVSQCHPADPAQDAHIQLTDGYYGDTGWRASVISSSNQAENASFHARHTHIQFNLTEIGTSYPAYDKRALACREIGHVTGLAVTPTTELAAEGQNNDCMSFWGNPDGQASALENPTNYTYKSIPGPHSIQLVGDTYAALRPTVSLSGTLATAAAQGPVLSGPSYGLTVTANQGQPAPEPTVKSIEITVDGQQVFYGEQSCSGSPCTMVRSWTFQTGGWATGAHTVKVIATDQLGLESAPKTLAVTVPTPETTIDSGPSGLTNNASPTFGFSSPQGFSQFSCHLDAAAFQACSSPKSYSGLSQGQHTFYARASDGAGEDDPTPASRTFTVDTQAPDTSISSGPSGAVSSSNASFNFTSPDASATFECRLNAGSWQSCASPKSYSALADGSHTFEVRAVDPAGNADPSPASRSWTVDTTAPTMQLAGPLKDAADRGETLTGTSYGLTVTTNDGPQASSGVKSIEIQVGGERMDYTEQFCQQGGCSMTFDWAFQTTEFSGGQHSVTVIANDQLGQQSQQSFSVTVPTAAQVTPDTLPCTAPDEPANFQLYSLGPAFEALPVTSVIRECEPLYPGEPGRANVVVYIYGDCVEPPLPIDGDATGCQPPLQIQTWPACERTLGDYELEPGVPYPYDDLGLRRGVPAASFDDGDRLELYAGTSTIVIFGADPQQVERAIAVITPEPLSAPPGTPSLLPALAPGGSLPPPMPGATGGDLPCAT